MIISPPEFDSLIRILDHKVFVIPKYQRHYSWGKDQREDLFNDIRNLMEKRKKYPDRIHFMATIVCLQTKESANWGSNSVPIYEVVDGQQRLTTLIILLKSTSIKLREIGQDNEANELDKLLVKDDGRLIIINDNHDDNSFLRNYLVQGQRPNNDLIKTEGDKNLACAIKDCEQFVTPLQLLDFQESQRILSHFDGIFWRFLEKIIVIRYFFAIFCQLSPTFA